MGSVLVLAALVNALVVGVLVLLLFWIRSMIRSLRSAVDEAVLRRAEYERALADYRHLMRHRIANPLTAVRGGLQSLRELPDLSGDERTRLLQQVQDAARRLERVALDPAPWSTEETLLGTSPAASSPVGGLARCNSLGRGRGERCQLTTLSWYGFSAVPEEHRPGRDRLLRSRRRLAERGRPGREEARPPDSLRGDDRRA